MDEGATQVLSATSLASGSLLVPPSHPRTSSQESPPQSANWTAHRTPFGLVGRRCSGLRQELLDTENCGPLMAAPLRDLLG